MEERVKPHRQTLSDTKQKAKENWWLYEASAKNLCHALGESSPFVKKPNGTCGRLKRAIAIARISKTAAFTFVPTDAVYAAEVVVIASDDYAMFAILQSNLHLVFAWNRAGKMKTDLRYSPTLCFTPFPLPDVLTDDLRAVGEAFYRFRHSILETRHIGLTPLHGLLHSADCSDSDISRFREMCILLDHCVLGVYGWTDLALEHHFHEVAYLPTSDRLRFTISESARFELLRRLLRLNHERYAEETVQVLHGGGQRR